MADGATVDVSEIQRLAALFDKAASKIPNDARHELENAARQVQTEAISNAAGMAWTGALAESVELTMGDDSARIEANVREAFFLEYGSPNTGAPRPWLSGPAERGAAELEDRLGKIADPLQ